MATGHMLQEDSLVSGTTALSDEGSTSDGSLTGSTKWLLCGILLLAGGIRIWGIEAGLPSIYHPDEPQYVLIAQNIFRGDLNPHAFSYPSLFFYLNALAYVPFYLVGKIVGVFDLPGDIVAPTMLLQGVAETSMPSTLLLGRLLTLLFGVGSVLLLFLIGRQLTGNKWVGLPAASLMAVSMTDVVYSRLITPDTFLVFFVLLAFWAAVQVFQRGAVSDYVLAGVAVGLAAGAKYNGALIAVALVAAHFLRLGPRGLVEGKLLLAGAVSLATFLVTTPFALLDYQNFLIGVQNEAQHYRTGHLGMEGETFTFYLYHLQNFEGLIFLLAVLEVIRGLFTRSKPIILLSIFPFAYFFLIVQFVVRNDRTLMPLIPFVYVLGASFLVSVASMWRLLPTGAWTSLARRVLPGISIIVGLLAIANPLRHTIETTQYRMEGIRTREEAGLWLAQTAPLQTKIAVESYGPNINNESFKVEGFSKMIDHEPQWYIDNNFEYLVFSQFTFRRFLDAQDRFPDEASRYKTLFASFVPVKSFYHPDYEIRIYRVTRQ